MDHRAGAAEQRRIPANRMADGGHELDSDRLGEHLGTTNSGPVLFSPERGDAGASPASATTARLPHVAARDVRHNGQAGRPA